MGSEQDDVLSIHQLSDENGEFSGFSPVLSSERDEGIRPLSLGKKKKKVVSKKPKSKPKKTKSTLNKENAQASTSAAGSKTQSSASVASAFDISKLSQADIDKLREVLGVTPQHTQYADENDIESVFGQSLENLPSLRVEVDNEDVVLEPEENPSSNLNQNFSEALFDTVEVEACDWEPPRLKAPEKGKPVSDSLARLINMSCTSQCDTETLLSKYKIPQNCDQACPPSVNSEIWKDLDRRAQSQDRGIVDIQNLVATGITPIIKLAEILTPQISSNKQAKDLLSDSLILLGQVQYNLSARRRYMIRPNLKKKYHSLCNISTPITTQLFGDDIARDVKNCDSTVSLGKDQASFRMNSNFRGRMGRYPRRGFGNLSYSGYGGTGGYNGPSQSRYQPYPQRGQYRPMSRPRGMKRVSAMVTSPNGQQN